MLLVLVAPVWCSFRSATTESPCRTAARADQCAGTCGELAGQLRFDVIWGLKTDEQVIEGQEQEVEEDLKKQPFTNFLDRARLMNLEAVLKAEEDTVKDEEKDVERSASRGKAYEKDEGYSRDQQRLKSFSKLADRLRFSNEESQELSDLQQKLKFQ
ncbi:unnamed protein product [Durusdinium trenchii]|uniref:Uncharacterized protein n=1 Tax=Durusdinium trenchii TaxID=1381693 RepID=A0ABP0N9N8_9DINO